MARSRYRSTSSNSPGSMSRLLSVIVVLLLVVLGGGMAVLATWDMPAPSKTVEKVIPDARFPH
ncbi:hypothetical protein [Azospirillum sp. ST 5-10]|uniref:hypothetical protein n=1 Tax=unclassified Azospirillum TaxID=2630922 RepID=UPI003F49DBE1